MKYGYFDNANKEYVITNPRTPAPWINYIGNGKFGGIVSATGGGLCFDSDASNRRVTRYKFNNQPNDRPGRYIYIRNEENGDYWSTGWQPVMKENQEFECRHGLGYTTIKTCYDNVESSVTYCVPIGKRYELWQVSLKNNSDKQKKLKVYSYVEFSWNDAKYDTLCHWPCMAFRADYIDGKILVDTVAEQLTGTPQYDYIATDLDVCGYDCSLKEFIGSYNSESNPAILEGDGVCTNSKMYSNSCVGVLCSQITLNPGEVKEFRYTLGATDKKNEVDTQIKDALTIENSIEEIKNYWQRHSDRMVINTPSDDMNTMINIWHAYQAKTTFDWSRFISYYERGFDRGFGFRDSMQDVLGIMHSEPEMAKERIKLLLSVQCNNGNARSVYFPATHKSVGGGRSDDHLWSIRSVCNYIKETGNYGFIDEVVDYDDGGKATVGEHLEKGIEFTMTHLGKHGLPDLLKSDWDDSLAPMNKGGTAGAESVFVFFQLADAAYDLVNLYKKMGRSDAEKRMQKIYDYCASKLDIIWDGEWFIRAFTPEGEKYCTKKDEFNKIHLIPQAWSVISHLADNKRANLAMDNVLKYLYTDKGLITHYPASDGFDPAKKSYFLFPAGARENGGIFFHSNAWPIIAFAMLGRGNDAFKCYESILPPRRNDIADICLTEPYVYSQTMIAPPHPNAWSCVNSWLTGTASWTYLAATQYILGIRPEYDGLCIDPQIPDDWDGFEVSRQCRGKTYNIRVCKGENKGLTVNGKAVEGNIVPWNISEEKDIDVILIK
ncbi:MAG: glycosyl transferase [Clostridia bacterium]|nr:glycosyl transferase [Clostridia bacterium]